MNKKSNSIYTTATYKDREKNVLKFYQSAVSIGELKKEHTIYNEHKKDNNYYDIPDSFIELIPLEEMSNKEQAIISEIDQFLKEENYIYFTPVFIVNNCDKVPSGIYCIDFVNRYLYKYKELNKEIFREKIIAEDFNICICYFIDLNKSVFIDGEVGFINGIIQIGRMYEKMVNIAKKNNFKIYSTFIPQQAFSYMVGINCRRQLFITNQFIKVL